MIETLLAFDPAVLAAFFGATVLFSLMPGADMMFVIASGAAGGPRAGVAAASGISIGVMVHVVLGAVGLGTLIHAYPAAYDAIRYFGAAYLAYLAWRTWRALPAGADQRGSRRYARAFRRGFVTNILNPKVALFVLAFLPQFTDPAVGPIWAQILWLGFIMALGGILTDGTIGALAGAVSGWLRRTGRLMNRLAVMVFGGLAARLVIE